MGIEGLIAKLREAADALESERTLTTRLRKAAEEVVDAHESGNTSESLVGLPGALRRLSNVVHEIRGRY